MLTAAWFVLLVLFLFVSLAADSRPFSGSGSVSGMLASVAFGGMFLLSICPFNIVYRPTRYYILRTIGKIVCAPFYQVDFKDFCQLERGGHNTRTRGSVIESAERH